MEEQNEVKKRGRPKKAPSYKYNEKVARQIKGMSSIGVTQEEMAAHFGFSVETLVKLYEKELLNGRLEANKEIAGALYSKAMKGDTAAMIFWLKTRARWSETQKVENKTDATITIKWQD